jgi:type I restriction enzyme M protein
MQLEVKEENGKIYSPIRKKWLTKTPEEIVRQAYLCILVNEYGYDLAQIKEEENVTGRGSAQARADFVIYKTVEDIEKNNNPLIIIEVKAEHIAIKEREFIQGELYARMYNAPFFVTHNGKETKFWRVKKDKSPGYREEIENIPNNNATEKEIKALFSTLKVFRETEFKRVLDACHDIIRNNDKLDPAIAFDEITKVLFMKVYAERNLKRVNEGDTIDSQWVEQADKYLGDNSISQIFNETKQHFGNLFFDEDEHILIPKSSVKTILEHLKLFNFKLEINKYHFRQLCTVLLLRKL